MWKTIGEKFRQRGAWRLGLSLKWPDCFKKWNQETRRDHMETRRALYIMMYAICQSPPPESLVISSSRWRLVLSSSYWTHLPIKHVLRGVLKWHKCVRAWELWSSLICVMFYNGTDHSLAWPMQHNVPSLRSCLCGSTPRPGHRFRSCETNHLLEKRSRWSKIKIWIQQIDQLQSVPS